MTFRLLRRKKALVAVLSLLSAGVLLAALYRAGPALVTWWALRDAREVCRAVEGKPSGPLEDHIKELTRKYGPLFRRGWFDCETLVRSIPTDGFTPEAAPAYFVFFSYLKAREDQFDPLSTDPKLQKLLVEEVLRWVAAVFASPKAKEVLLNLLCEDYELLPGKRDPAGMMKLGLVSVLLADDPENYRGRPRGAELQLAYRKVVNSIGAQAWDMLLRDSRHPREKVRAAAILLLSHHPRAEVVLQRAREALADPSPLVRLAGASALAWHRDPGGQELLIGGLSHQRWEIRWWCGRHLTLLGQVPGREAIGKRRDLEPDGWVRNQLRYMLRSFPQR